MIGGIRFLKGYVQKLRDRKKWEEGTLGFIEARRNRKSGAVEILMKPHWIEAHSDNWERFTPKRNNT